MTPEELALLSERIRAPMVGIEEVRIRSARQSTNALFVASAVEGTVGLVTVLGAETESGQVAGGVLFVGAFAHAAQGWLGLDLSRRRHAAFLADLAASEGRPEAWPALARDLRLDLERDARGNAFAAGTYAGVLGAGLVAWAAAGGEEGEPPLALVLIGGTGLVNHVIRWRTATRLSVDMDTVPFGVP